MGLDTDSYAAALRHVVRQDPDVIFVGEIRDPESALSAIQAAETGHLVISTMHTIDSTETINRLLDLFPAQQQREVRTSFAGALRGIVSQRLVKRSDGKGRVPVVEVLVSTGRVYDRIIDPDATIQLHDIIAEGGFYGMQTFDHALVARRGRMNLTGKMRGHLDEPARTCARSPRDVTRADRLLASTCPRPPLGEPRAPWVPAVAHGIATKQVDRMNKLPSHVWRWGGVLDQIRPSTGTAATITSRLSSRCDASSAGASQALGTRSTRRAAVPRVAWNVSPPSGSEPVFGSVSRTRALCGAHDRR